MERPTSRSQGNQLCYGIQDIVIKISFSCSVRNTVASRSDILMTGMFYLFHLQFILFNLFI